MSGCKFVSDRRASTQRSASDAEADDIIHLMEILDNSSALQRVKFAASSLDRIPKYGPDEVNICAVVDKQLQTDIVLGDLATKVDLLHDEQQKFSMKLDQAVKSIQQTSSSRHSAAVDIHQVQPAVAPEPDRSRNVVIFGIAENRDHNTWHSEIDKVLCAVTGRNIAIADATRLGGRYAADKVRPVLTKLQSVWDRRLILV